MAYQFSDQERSNISYALALIEEWVEQLQENDLPDQVRRSGANFFDYMHSRGVYRGWIAQLIKKATNIAP